MKGRSARSRADGTIKHRGAARCGAVRNHDGPERTGTPLSREIRRDCARSNVRDVGA